GAGCPRLGGHFAATGLLLTKKACECKADQADSQRRIWGTGTTRVRDHTSRFARTGRSARTGRLGQTAFDSAISDVDGAVDSCQPRGSTATDNQKAGVSDDRTGARTRDLEIVRK